MTHQDQIIIICILAFIAVPLGTFITFKTINKLSRPPVNTLVRPGDIELVDYIEPIRPQQSIDYPDLLERPIPIYERISNHMYYERAPSYWSGNPPTYHTDDRLYINSSLENYINLDFFVIAIILGVLFFFLVNYYILKFSETQSEFIFTNGISTNKITFTENYQEILSGNLGNDSGYFVCFKKMYWLFLTPKWTIFDIISWLELLEEEQDYSVIIEVVANDSEISDRPRILLTREFIVNYKSNPVLISKFLSGQLDILCILFDIKIENHLLLIHYASLKAVN